MKSLPTIKFHATSTWVSEFQRIVAFWVVPQLKNHAAMRKAFDEIVKLSVQNRPFSLPTFKCNKTNKLIKPAISLYPLLYIFFYQQARSHLPITFESSDFQPQCHITDHQKCCFSGCWQLVCYTLPPTFIVLLIWSQKRLPMSSKLRKIPWVILIVFTPTLFALFN